jgi:hypothetical protein
MPAGATQNPDSAQLFSRLLLPTQANETKPPGVARLTENRVRNPFTIKNTLSVLHAVAPESHATACSDKEGDLLKVADWGRAMETATGGDAPFYRPPSRQLQIDFGEVTRTATLTDLRVPSIIDYYICLEEVRRDAVGTARPPSAIGSPRSNVRELV